MGFRRDQPAAGAALENTVAWEGACSDWYEDVSYARTATKRIKNFSGNVLALETLSVVVVLRGMFKVMIYSL